MGIFKKLFVFILGFAISFNVFAEEKKELLFYVGITIVKPINELAQNFKKKCQCDIKILQGGSQDLYESAKSSQKGDLYVAGSLSYRQKYLPEGFLLDAAFVGYNKVALVVPKGNPKQIPADLSVLSDKKYRVVLGNVESGSIGDETKKVLMKFGNYEEAILNAVSLVPDSRNLTKAIKDGEADVGLNWFATTFWDDNKQRVEPIIVDEKYAEKTILVLNLLKTSKYPDLTKEFIKYATSQEGRAIFHKYGFLDDNDLKNFDNIKF
jgi:molybdate transport system substrate-binding protein